MKVWTQAAVSRLARDSLIFGVVAGFGLGVILTLLVVHPW